LSVRLGELGVEEGLFISGPDVIENFRDGRPVFRRFESRFVRIGMLLPKAGGQGIHPDFT